MAGVNATETLALIVEDDPATRALEEEVLEADGFAVLTAKNGEEGIRLAYERRPAVILLDLALPTASGFDVLEDPQEFSRDCEHSGRGYQCVRHARRELCLAGRVGVRPEALRHRRPGHASEAGTENGRRPAGTQGTNLCVNARATRLAFSRGPQP